MIDEAVMTDVRSKGISRLCHFTKAVNLPHIIAAGELQSTAELHESVQSFHQNDAQRLDGRPDYICCSVEYPNTWYLDRVRLSDGNFCDWVVFTFNPEPLWSTDTLYCPHNAARSYGGGIRGGFDGYSRLFAQEVYGHQTYVRSDSYPAYLPTDQQAEVLVRHSVPLASVQKIIVPSQVQASTEAARLRLVSPHVEPPIFAVCPDMFDKYRLSQLLKRGVRPDEYPRDKTVDGGRWAQ